MKKLALLGIIVSGFFGLQEVQAAEIQNFQVVRNGTQLYISWDPLSSSDFEGQAGYAVSWGDFQSQLRKDKYAKQYLGNVTNLSIRGADFKRNAVYYFRVFSYKEDGRTKILKHGSKILKWKETDYGVYDTDLVEPNDPLIVDSSGSSSSSSSSAFEFGSVRVLALDTFADISWSAHTKLAKSDYDGFRIEIASDLGFSNILGTLNTERGKIRARIKGLTPSTQYYVRGSFHKDDEKFGTGDVKDFQTIRSIPRDASSVASRNLLKIEKRKYLELDLGGDSSSSTTSSSSTSTSTTSTSSTSTSTTTSTTSSSSSADIQARIKEIESTIASLNAELIRLKAQLRKTTGSSSSSRVSTRSTPTRSISSRSSSSSRMSIRERLAARLAKLRSK